MIFRKRAFVFLLSLALMLTYLPVSAFAESGPDTGGMQSIGLNSSVQVKVSNSSPAVLVFTPQKTGGYLIKGFSASSTQARVFINESCPVDPESDSDGWNRIQYDDFDGDDTYNEATGEPTGSTVTIDYPFYAESGKSYKIEVETAFDENPCTYDMSISETDRAGRYNGLSYIIQNIDSGETTEAVCKITGYYGSETGELVIPGSINGYRVDTIADYAVSGSFSSVTVGEGVRYIQNRGISGDENLLTVSLPSTLADIYDSPFSIADSRQKVLFPNGNENYELSDNMLIDNSRNELKFAFGPAKTSVTVPAGIKEIDAYAFDTLQPEVINIPKSVREVFQMPGSLKEMHIANANCKVSYYGIPWSDSDSENDKAIYTIIVYAPQNGSLEQYCKENNITFRPEGAPYDPSVLEPMDKAVSLTVGEPKTASFTTLDGGAYQDFEISVPEDGMYGLNLDFTDINGDISISEAYTYQMKEGNNTVQAVKDSPINGDGCPGLIFYLSKGKTYTFRMSVTDAYRNSDFDAVLHARLSGAEDITVNGAGWDDYVASWETERMSKLLRFTANADGAYTISRRDTASDDQGDLTMTLYAANGDGSVKEVDSSNQTFKANLKKGVYYIAITLSGEEASAEIKVTSSGPAVGSSVKAADGSTVKVKSNTSKTVAYTKAKNAKSVTVPSTVKISGKSYKVTEISKNAFKNSKAKTVTIGKNVKTIKSKAFSGSKVTTLKIKSKSLTKKSVKGSLKGSKVKTIKVNAGTKAQNKKLVKKYKKYFTKANAGRKVTVK